MRAAAQRRAKPIETVPTLQISVFSKPAINCTIHPWVIGSTCMPEPRCVPRPRCVWLARGSLPGAGRGRPCGRPAWLAGWLAGGEEGRSRRVDGARTINYAAPMSRQTKSMFVHSEGFSEHGPRSHQTPTRPLTEINKSVRTRAPSLPPTDRPRPARRLRTPSRTPNEAPRDRQQDPRGPIHGPN